MRKANSFFGLGSRRKEVSLSEVRRMQEDASKDACGRRDFSRAKSILKQKPASYARGLGLKLESEKKERAIAQKEQQSKKVERKKSTTLTAKAKAQRDLDSAEREVNDAEASGDKDRYNRALRRYDAAQTALEKLSKRAKNPSDHWIAGTIKRPGALHRKLGVAAGQDIPPALIREAKAHPERFVKGRAAQVRLEREANEALELARFHKAGRRRNPASDDDGDTDARALYQGFHGEPSAETITAHGTSDIPRVVTALGELTEMTLASGSVLSFDGKGFLLTSNPAGTQLYIVGAPASFTASDLGEFDTTKDLIDLGPVKYIVYRTEKGFDKFKSYEYKHKLGEESGDRPTLIYDRRNHRLLLAGGNYEVRPEGIVD